MSKEPEVLIDRKDGVITVTMNRPERRNAITVPMMNIIRETILAAGEDRDARVIVLTGKGDRAFCAGADLTPAATPFVSNGPELSLPFANLLRAGHRSEIPIIGAINGLCLAGAMGLLGMCDMVVASRTARFGMPEVKIGLFPMQIVAVLRDVVPPRLFAELCYTGRMISAEEAASFGLVNRLAEPSDLAVATASLVNEVLAVSPMAVRRGKYALRAMAGMSFDQMIAFGEQQIDSMLATADAREGLAAFNEKRAPIWPNA